MIAPTLVESWTDNIYVDMDLPENVEPEPEEPEPLVPTDRLITMVIVPLIFLFLPALIFGNEFGKGGVIAGLILGDILLFIAFPISMGLIVLVLIATTILALKGSDTL